MATYNPFEPTESPDGSPKVDLGRIVLDRDIDVKPDKQFDRGNRASLPPLEMLSPVQASQKITVNFKIKPQNKLINILSREKPPPKPVSSLVPYEVDDDGRSAESSPLRSEKKNDQNEIGCGKDVNDRRLRDKDEIAKRLQSWKSLQLKKGTDSVDSFVETSQATTTDGVEASNVEPEVEKQSSNERHSKSNIDCVSDFKDSISEEIAIPLPENGRKESEVGDTPTSREKRSYSTDKKPYYESETRNEGRRRSRSSRNRSKSGARSRRPRDASRERRRRSRSRTRGRSPRRNQRGSSGEKREPRSSTKRQVSPRRRSRSRDRKRSTSRKRAPLRERRRTPPRERQKTPSRERTRKRSRSPPRKRSPSTGRKRSRSLERKRSGSRSKNVTRSGDRGRKRSIRRGADTPHKNELPATASKRSRPEEQSKSPNRDSTRDANKLRDDTRSARRRDRTLSRDRDRSVEEFERRRAKESLESRERHSSAHKRQESPPGKHKEAGHTESAVGSGKQTTLENTTSSTNASDDLPSLSKTSDHVRDSQVGLADTKVDPVSTTVEAPRKKSPSSSSSSSRSRSSSGSSFKKKIKETVRQRVEGRDKSPSAEAESGPQIPDMKHEILSDNRHERRSMHGEEDKRSQVARQSKETQRKSNSRNRERSPVRRKTSEIRRKSKSRSHEPAHRDTGRDPRRRESPFQRRQETPAQGRRGSPAERRRTNTIRRSAVYRSPPRVQKPVDLPPRKVTARAKSSSSSSSSSSDSPEAKTLKPTEVTSEKVATHRNRNESVDAEWTSIGDKGEIFDTSQDHPPVKLDATPNAEVNNLPSVVSDDSCNDRVKKVVDEKVQCWSTDKRASIDQWLMSSSEPAAPDQSKPINATSGKSSALQDAVQRIDSIITSSSAMHSLSTANPFRGNIPGVSSFPLPPPGFLPPFFPPSATGFPFMSQPGSISSSQVQPVIPGPSNLITIQTQDSRMTHPSNPSTVTLPTAAAPPAPLPPAPVEAVEPEAPPMPSPSYSPSLSPIPSKSAGGAEQSEHDLKQLQTASTISPAKTVGSGIASQTLQNLQDILMNIKPGPSTGKIDISEQKAADMLTLSDFTPPPNPEAVSNKKLDDLERLFPPPATAAKIKLPKPGLDKAAEKKKMQDNVAALAKKYLKPYFTKNKIDKDQYKHIMRKVVFKCTDGKKSGDVKPEKVKKLVVNYAAHLQQKSSKSAPQNS